MAVYRVKRIRKGQFCNVIDKVFLLFRFSPYLLPGDMSYVLSKIRFGCRMAIELKSGNKIHLLVATYIWKQINISSYFQPSQTCPEHWKCISYALSAWHMKLCNGYNFFPDFSPVASSCEWVNFNSEKHKLSQFHGIGLQNAFYGIAFKSKWHWPDQI